MRQYFVSESLQCGSIIELPADTAHHVRNVLRMKSGEMIRLVDIDQRLFLARLIVGDQVKAEITEQLPAESSRGMITCCLCLIKREKWELLVQKAAELGADRIVPVISRRTIIHIDEKEVEKKLQRWNKIALEACQQSNRTDICTVERPIYLVNIDQYMSENNLLAYEDRQGNNIIDLADDRDITIVFGPEGGFACEEAEFLNSLGFVSCSLGERILRAETACLYALAVIDAKRNAL
ncbi:MAG: 16S rRNA (uracil(1498)-N(3))-methyltransferase [Erysipelotrichaceae bacterium]|nr:16S rRNA (uracil(1498)-N(3))-methyltransferase [Erysipelotrichaceae bacterium]